MIVKIRELGGGASDDVRTVDKLVDCVNDTVDDCHMWLAPFIDSRRGGGEDNLQTYQTNSVTTYFS